LNSSNHEDARAFSFRKRSYLQFIKLTRRIEIGANSYLRGSSPPEKCCVWSNEVENWRAAKSLRSDGNKFYENCHPGSLSGSGNDNYFALPGANFRACEQTDRVGRAADWEPAWTRRYQRWRSGRRSIIGRLGVGR